MFWRLNTGFLVAGMVAFGGYLAAKKDLPRTVRVLNVCAVVVAAMITIQGLLMP
jgi:hypothetical protein